MFVAVSQVQKTTIPFVHGQDEFVELSEALESFSAVQEIGTLLQLLKEHLFRVLGVLSTCIQFKTLLISGYIRRYLFESGG